MESGASFSGEETKAKIIRGITASKGGLDKELLKKARSSSIKKRMSVAELTATDRVQV